MANGFTGIHLAQRRFLVVGGAIACLACMVTEDETAPYIGHQFVQQKVWKSPKVVLRTARKSMFKALHVSLTVYLSAEHRKSVSNI